MNIKPLEYINALNSFNRSMDTIQNIFHPDNKTIYKPIADALGISRIEVTFIENDSKPQKGTIYGAENPVNNTLFRQTEHAQNGSVADYRLYKDPSYPEWDDEDREIISGFVKIMFVYNGRAEIIAMAKKMMFVDWAMETGTIKAFFFTLGEMIIKKELADYGICRFNIKRFSVVNRNYGRDKGTEIMKRYVTGFIEKYPGSSVFRIGGDNFILVFRKCDYDKVVSGMKYTSVDAGIPGEPAIRISSSAGIYLCSGREKNADEIMTKITAANAMAKTMSKDGIFLFDEKAEERIDHRKMIEAQFVAALENGEFAAFYQPKVDIKTGRVVGTEALCRWIKDGRVIPPIEFIPILEQSNAICKLDFYMLDKVCQDIRNWLDKGNMGVKASVNLSRMHLGDDRLLEKVINIIDRNRVPHELIEIELTETTSDVDFDELRDIVNGFHKNGISASVDDFGVGYSSLTLIKDLPWDVLKIDRSFLPDGSENDGQKLIMLRHVVSMAQGLGLQCIIEGVETQEQVSLLMDINCFLAQGFYFDKPLPKEEFEQKLVSLYNV